MATHSFGIAVQKYSEELEHIRWGRWILLKPAGTGTGTGTETGTGTRTETGKYES